MITSCDNVQNAQVGLMRNDPVDVISGDSGALKCGIDRLRYCARGEAHNSCALHFQKTRLGIYCAVLRERVFDRQRFHAQIFRTRAVCRDKGGLDAETFVLGRAVNCRRCAVAEQDAGAAVGVVDDTAERFCRNDEHSPRLARLDVAVRDIGRGNKAGAGIVDVERTDRACAQLVLKDRCGVRRVGIGRAGADQDQIKLTCVDLRVRERILRCAERKLPCMHVFCNAAFAHTCALYDPFIISIDHVLKHCIGKDKIRQARARADQLTVDDFHAPQNF